jgi:hypothetical protein
MINFVLLFVRFVNGLPKCPIELLDFTLVLFLAVFQMTILYTGILYSRCCWMVT